MAKTDGQSAEVMGAAELKPLLLLSKRKPVSCAIGMTKDKQGVILLHKRTKPRKLMAELLRQGKGGGLELDRASLRFGRASVDGGSDGTTVNFSVNKPPPGPMHMKMVEKLRPAGFRRCEITVDAKLEDESDEDDPEEADPAEAPGIGSRDAGAAAARPNRTGAGAEVPGHGTAAQPDAATLKATLRGLAEQIRPFTSSDPARGRSLIAIASAAHDSLVQGDLASTQSGIERLRHTLASTGGAGSAGPGPGSVRPPDAAPGGRDDLTRPIGDAGQRDTPRDTATPPIALGFLAPAVAPALETTAVGGAGAGVLAGGAVGGLLIGPQLELQQMADRARVGAFWAAHDELARLDPTNRLAGPFVTNPGWQPGEADLRQMLKALADAKAATTCTTDNPSGLTPDQGALAPDIGGAGNRLPPTPPGTDGQTANATPTAISGVRRRRGGFRCRTVNGRTRPSRGTAAGCPRIRM